MKTLLLALLGVVAFQTALAADQQTAAKPAASGGEKLDVESIKQKYWAQGDEGQMGVVQNRAYSRERRFEFDVTAGTLSNDPFQSMRTIGASLGYHFNEYFSIHALAWKIFSKKSSAANDFLHYAGFEASTNPETSYLGGETRYSLIYGKLSLMGLAIIYYDLHFALGLGSLKTDSGTYLAPIGGIGQQIYLNNWSALWFAYRLLNHSERVVGLPDKRSVWTDSITIGLNFFLPKI